jgi:hypothetical protein
MEQVAESLEIEPIDGRRREGRDGHGDRDCNGGPAACEEAGERPAEAGE